MLKKILLFVFLLVLTIPDCYSATNNNPKGTIIISGKGVHSPHLSSPYVTYHLASSMLSIDFGNQPIDDYTVTISSPFTDMDYFITSSYTTIPLSVDGISDYSIIIETAEGDVFEGVLLASDYSSVDSM